MKVREQCSCGAAISVTADSGDALGAVTGWRRTHLHEAAEVATEEVEE